MSDRGQNQSMDADTEEQHAQESELPNQKVPSSGNLVKIIIGVLALGAVVVIATALAVASFDPSLPDLLELVANESQKSTVRTTNSEADGSTSSSVQVAGSKFQFFARIYAEHIKALVMEHKWIVLTLSIVLIIFIAGAITGGILYQKHQQRDMAEIAERDRLVKELSEKLRLPSFSEIPLNIRFVIIFYFSIPVILILITILLVLSIYIKVNSMNTGANI